MVGWGLRRGGRRGEEGFGIAGEVRRAVGGVETLWENDEGGSCLCGFEDFGVCAGEVGGFIGACGVFVRSERFALEGRGSPVANCIRASFKGFFRRPVMLNAIER